MKFIGCKIIVSGRVQGVGFRYYTSWEAGKRGLTGHAKNLYNGNVEVLLYGNSEKIEDMVDWLSKGPRTAKVDSLDVTSIPFNEVSSFTSC